MKKSGFSAFFLFRSSGFLVSSLFSGTKERKTVVNPCRVLREIIRRKGGISLKTNAKDCRLRHRTQFTGAGYTRCLVRHGTTSAMHNVSQYRAGVSCAYCCTKHYLRIISVTSAPHHTTLVLPSQDIVF